MTIIINRIINIFSSNLTIVFAATIVTAIGLTLLSEVFAQIKAENVSGDLGKYGQDILYFHRAFATDQHNFRALNGKSLHNVHALYDKGVALGDLGNYTGAIEYFDKVLDIDPHDVYALNNIGFALKYLGNYTGAIEYLDRALAIDQLNVAALNNSSHMLHL
jgi:tetratricopeptide (TPR) repeat protein